MIKVIKRKLYILTKYSGSGAPGNPFRHGGALQLKYISRWKHGFNSQNIPSSMSATVDVSNPSYFSESDPVGLQMPTKPSNPRTTTKR